MYESSKHVERVRLEENSWEFMGEAPFQPTYIFIEMNNEYITITIQIIISRFGPAGSATKTIWKHRIATHSISEQ